MPYTTLSVLKDYLGIPSGTTSEDTPLTAAVNAAQELVDGYCNETFETVTEARCGIGYVPEERGIFATLSVEENLTLPPVIAKGGMNLKEIYQLFPNLEERRKSPGTKLSGGEQQMLAMARILRTGARLLLLDEPTEGLAPVIVQRIGEVLQTLKTRRMTILLVEQNFRFASKIADRFYVVDHGKVIDRFTVGELPGRMTMLNEALGV